MIRGLGRALHFRVFYAIAQGLGRGQFHVCFGRHGLVRWDKVGRSVHAILGQRGVFFFSPSREFPRHGHLLYHHSANSNVSRSPTWRATIHHKRQVIFVGVRLYRHEGVGLGFAFYEGYVQRLVIRAVGSLCSGGVVFFGLRNPTAMFPLPNLRVGKERVCFLPYRGPNRVFIGLSSVRYLRAFGVGVSIYVPQAPLPIVVVVVRASQVQFSSLYRGLGQRTIKGYHLSKEEQTYSRSGFGSFFLHGLYYRKASPFLRRHFLGRGGLFTPTKYSYVVRHTSHSGIRRATPTT